MGTTAKFFGEVTHGYNSYGFPILFSKQSHCTCFLCFIDGHHICTYIHRFVNLLVNDFFYFSDFFSCHGLTIAKVETGSCRILVGTLLFNILTKHFLQSTL